MTQQQLGFGFEQMLEEQESAHLPAAMAEAIPYYRQMIEKHHAAMLAGNEKEAMAIRKEAHRLAEKLNGGHAGILANPDSPGYVLERETAAAPGTIPLWGQEGDFTVTIGEMPVRVKLDGMFGIGATWVYAPGFETHIVDKDKPFFSETGYRSFMSCPRDLPAGTTPEEYVCNAIQAHIDGECKSRVKRRVPKTRER